MSVQLNSMTVGELRKLLDRYDEAVKVVFSYSARDYLRTILLGEIKSAELGEAMETTYHGGFRLCDDKDKERHDGSEPEPIEVLILG